MEQQLFDEVFEDFQNEFSNNYDPKSKFKVVQEEEKEIVCDSSEKSDGSQNSESRPNALPSIRDRFTLNRNHYNPAKSFQMYDCDEPEDKPIDCPVPQPSQSDVISLDSSAFSNDQVSQSSMTVEQKRALKQQKLEQKRIEAQKKREEKQKIREEKRKEKEAKMAKMAEIREEKRLKREQMMAEKKAKMEEIKRQKELKIKQKEERAKKAAERNAERKRIFEEKRKIKEQKKQELLKQRETLNEFDKKSNQNQYEPSIDWNTSNQERSLKPDTINNFSEFRKEVEMLAKIEGNLGQNQALNNPQFYSCYEKDKTSSLNNPFSKGQDYPEQPADQYDNFDVEFNTNNYKPHSYLSDLNQKYMADPIPHPDQTQKFKCYENKFKPKSPLKTFQKDSAKTDPSELIIHKMVASLDMDFGIDGQNKDYNIEMEEDKCVEEEKLEVDAFEEDDIENQIRMKNIDKALLDQFNTKIGLERQYILFGELPPSGEIQSADLIQKQNFIRKKLGLHEGNRNGDISLENAFKLIDALNLQTLFVYDPEYEKFSTFDGTKLPTNDKSDKALSYFKTEDRECAICAEEYKKNDILMKLATCGHVFHAECSENYIYYNPECCYCRQKVCHL